MKTEQEMVEELRSSGIEVRNVPRAFIPFDNHNGITFSYEEVSISDAHRKITSRDSLSLDDRKFKILGDPDKVHAFSLRLASMNKGWG